MLGTAAQLSMFEGGPCSVSIDVESARTMTAMTRWTTGATGPIGYHFLSFDVDSNRIAVYRGDPTGTRTLAWSEETLSPVILQTIDKATTGLPTWAPTVSHAQTHDSSSHSSAHSLADRRSSSVLPPPHRRRARVGRSRQLKEGFIDCRPVSLQSRAYPLIA